MVKTSVSRSDVDIPIMLWITQDLGDDQITLDIFRQDCEVLMADSIEQGVDTLVHQPVDILVLDVSVLSSADPALVTEIGRCWPYLLCLILSEEQISDTSSQQSMESINALYLQRDPEILQQQLLSGIGQSAGKHLIH